MKLQRSRDEESRKLKKGGEQVKYLLGLLNLLVVLVHWMQQLLLHHQQQLQQLQHQLLESMCLSSGELKGRLHLQNLTVGAVAEPMIVRPHPVVIGGVVAKEHGHHPGFLHGVVNYFELLELQFQ